VIAAWLVLRDATMLRKERWVLAMIGVVGLGFLTATGMEGGELVFDHAAGMSTEAMQAEIQNRAGGHEHAAGEEHDEDAMPATTDTEIDGVNWRCTGDKCVGTPVGRKAPGSRMDECRKVAAALGRVASFASRGKELTKRDLDTCNRSAR